MQEDVHLDPNSELYIPTHKIEKLEDLLDNPPVQPAIEEVVSAVVPEVYYTDVDATTQPAVEIPPMDSLSGIEFQAPEDAPVLAPPMDDGSSAYGGVSLDSTYSPSIADQTVVPLAAGRDWWFWGAVGASLLSFVVLIAQVALASMSGGAGRLMLNKEFLDCQNSGGQVSLTNTLIKRCETSNGFYVFEDVSPEAGDSIALMEANEAKTNNKIIFSTAQLGNFDRSITSNTQGVGLLPIATYSKAGEETVVKVVINNSNISADSSYQNDINIQKVRNFLDRGTEFQGFEVLGNESLVLQAFQSGPDENKSQTLSELDITSSVLQKSRSVWGVDGAGDEKFLVKARLFGSIRDNVVMVETTLPYSAQKKLNSTVLTACQQKNKSITEIENCFIDQLKTTPEYQTLAEESLKNALIAAGLQ